MVSALVKSMEVRLRAGKARQALFKKPVVMVRPKPFTCCKRPFTTRKMKGTAVRSPVAQQDALF